MSGTDGAAAAVASASVQVRESLAHVCAASDFIARALSTDPGLLPALIESSDLERTLSPGDFAARAPQVPSATTSVAEADWMADLRRWRRREFVRIAWRDLASWAPLTETLADLSACADAALAALRRWHCATAHCGRHGQTRRRRTQLLLRHRPHFPFPRARRDRRAAPHGERGILHAYRADAGALA